jgi:hypothetical protein
VQLYIAPFAMSMLKMLRYKAAGHGVFGPPVDSDNPKLSTLGSLGSSVEDNNTARQNSWPQALALFDQVLKP